MHLSIGPGSHIHIHPSLSSRSQVRPVFLSQKGWREWVDFNYVFNTKKQNIPLLCLKEKRQKKENSLALSKMLKGLYSWGLVMLNFKKKPFHCQTCNRESNRCQRTPDTRHADRTCFWMQQKGCWINAVDRVILPSPLVSLHRLPVNNSNQI